MLTEHLKAGIFNRWKPIAVEVAVERTLRNYDGDGNGNRNIKKAVQVNEQTTTLHVHHAFLYISLPGPSPPGSITKGLNVSLLKFIIFIFHIIATT